MDLTFRGEHDYAVDDKGRIVMPPSFRSGLTETVVIGRGAEGQIWVYPKTVFEQRLQKMSDVNETEQDANFDMGLRFWLAASDAELDRQGRLSLPSLLRKQADITSGAIIVGNGDRVEIWSPARWDQKYAEWVGAYKNRNDDYGAMRRSGLRP